MTRSLLKQFSLLLALFFVFGCSSTTMIRASDPQAKIYVDGEYQGRGAVKYTDMKIVGSQTQVRLEKEGCSPQEYSFSRNEQWNTGALIAGVLIVPLFWSREYSAERTLDFSCQPN
jgi:hypothetical protein